MSQPGEQLLQRARAGDPDALNELLGPHQQRLYNICLRMVGNRDDAAELTQEAFLQILQNLQQFRGDARLSTWITRIAINACISFIRRQKHRNHPSIDQPRNGHPIRDSDDADAPAAQLRDTREPSPLQRVQDNEDLDRLDQAIASLEPEFRAVLVLRDIDGQDYQQISHSLDLAVGTVKSRLFRARLALRQALQESEQTSPPRRTRRSQDAS